MLTNQASQIGELRHGPRVSCRASHFPRPAILIDVRLKLAALLLAGVAGNLMAQGWEIGAGGGYGLYRNGSVWAPAGIVSAGVRNRFTITSWLGENSCGRLSGEVRYTYQDGDPFLETGGLRTNVQGQSHAFHYGLLLHLRDENAAFRPYLTAGLGAKLYEVTGPESLCPPFIDIARLRAVSEWKPLVVAGGGIRLRAGANLSLRIEVLDYITPFPKAMIEPVAYATARGFLHQFTPSVGVAFTWKADRTAHPSVPAGARRAKDR